MATTRCSSAGVGLADLEFSWTEELRAAPFVESGYGNEFLNPYDGPVQSLYAVLGISYGGGDSVRVVIPHAEQNAGVGIDFVEFGDGTRVPFGQVLAAAGAHDLNPQQRDNDLTGSGAVYGGPGNDVIRADHAIGGPGRDTLIGTADSDVLIGGMPFGSFAGVMGTLWDDGSVFRGGPGNDKLWTTAGPDTIEYELADGSDIVTDLQHDDLYYSYGGILFSSGVDLDEIAREPAHRAALLANQDTLKFGSGISPGDIFVYREPRSSGGANFDYLVFAHRDGMDAVRFQNWYMTRADRGISPEFDPHEQLARVEFDDGTVWDRTVIDGLAANAPRRDVSYLGFSFFGSPGNDVVHGMDGQDFLSGWIGNDVLDGGAGDDVYFFQPGDGVDTISESVIGTFDVLSFGVGITPDMLTLGLGSLLIRVGDSGDEVHIEGFNPDDALNSGRVEKFTFGDGSSLSYAELLERGFDITGTPGNDTLIGTNVEDRIAGLGGDDTLHGGSGNDSYFFGRGSGADFVDDSAGDEDAVILGEGITPEDVTATRDGNTLALSIRGAADRLTLHQEPGAGYLIEEVRFPDGTVWGAATVEALADAHETPAVPSPSDGNTTGGGDPDHTVPVDTNPIVDVGQVPAPVSGGPDGPQAPVGAQLPDSGFAPASDSSGNGPGNATEAGADSAFAQFPITREREAVAAGIDGIPPESLRDSRTGALTESSEPRTDDAPDHGGTVGAARNRNSHVRRFDIAPNDEVIDSLESLLFRTAHSPFELAAAELQRPNSSGNRLNAVEIARRWDAVARYGDWLASHHDDEEEGGAALDWQLEHAALGMGGFGAGEEFTGVTGVGQGAASLQVLRGLSDGFQQLRA
jgi:Ca2+-binding RTX toxin-like protein